MRTKYLGVLVAVMLVVGACGATSQPSSSAAPGSPSDTHPAGASDQPPVSTEPSAATSDAPSGVTVEATVGTGTGAELKFDPGDVTVQAGADVRLTFENRSTVPHNLTFQGPPDIATATVVAPGASETVEFKAPDPGEYAFVCTLHPGMGGTLVVEAG